MFICLLLMISCNLFRLESDIGASGLRHLLTAGNAIQTAILSEQCSRLLEVEGDIGIDGLMTDRQFTKDEQSLVCTFLILYRAADGHVVVPPSPILWQTLKNPLWTFRYDVEIQVAPSLYHQPCLFAPFVGIRATGSTSRSSLTVFCFYYLVGISRQLLQQVIGSRMGIDA